VRSAGIALVLTSLWLPGPVDGLELVRRLKATPATAALPVLALGATATERAAARHASGALEAPMPGKVIAVRVSPGQQVARGDELVVVEAMKMENALRAPRAGTVKAVAARVGDMVAPGVALVELE